MFFDVKFLLASSSIDSNRTVLDEGSRRGFSSSCSAGSAHRVFSFEATSRSQPPAFAGHFISAGRRGVLPQSDESLAAVLIFRL